MQNNHETSGNSGAFRKFLKEKGYYIVLFLCVAAVGISGYFLVTNAITEDKSLNEPPLSVATPAEIPSTKPQQTKPSVPAAVQQPSVPASAEADGHAESAIVSAPAETSPARIWPVSGETIGAYSMDELSYNTTTRDWRTHEGVDLAAATGTIVKAAAAGTVTAVYDDEYLGTTVVLSHESGYATHYSNLAAMPTVTVGQRVKAGDTLGSVGETALLEAASEPHLHFAVFHDGVCIDPNDFLN